MKIHDYLGEIGFSKKESDIYLALYRLGTQPASVISKFVRMERTYVYKILLSFAEKNLVSVTEKNGVKHFFIPDISILRKYLKSEKDRYQRMDDDFHVLEAELAQYDNRYSSKLPKIDMRDGIEGIRYLYKDIFDCVSKNGYISIKMFASNTIMSQAGGESIVKTYAEDFFTKMQERNVHIETFLGNGLWIMESLGKTNSIADLEHLPAANSSIQIFVVGKIVYVIIFKEIPFGIRFESEDLARTLHFLFDHMKTD